MVITTDTIIYAAAVWGAVTIICGVIYTVIVWIQKQNKQNVEIDAIKDELCVLSYSMLAALDGLMQQGCNGNVSKAHEALEKHLNKAAHDKNKE